MAAIEVPLLSKPAGVEWASVPAKWIFPCPRDGRYRIFAASKSCLRQQAGELVNRVYQKRVFNLNSDAPPHLIKSEAEVPAFTLLASNDKGHPVGTVSLNLDAQGGLPCDEIFSEEVEALRSQGHRLMEVTSFAISEKHTRSKALLVHLMDFIFILARRECPSGTVVIEVHPRHENFYQRFMKFVPAGPVRSCRRVHGAPARLLSLDLTLQRETIQAQAGSVRKAGSESRRSLYSEFHALEDEGYITRFLERSFFGETMVRSMGRVRWGPMS